MYDISVAIPTYEMRGVGHEIIQYALKSLEIQKFKNFEVVISDQSEDNKTEEVCKKWSSVLNIKYIKNPFSRKVGSANRNNATKNCEGNIIKYLDADDYLYDEYSLENIYLAFQNDNTKWIASNYIHTYDRVNLFRIHCPTWNDNMCLVNTIGSPTGVAIKREYVLYMDENVDWLCDADLYQRMYYKYGEPKFLRKITAVNVLWKNQMTLTLPDSEKNKEVYYIKKKYGKD